MQYHPITKAGVQAFADEIEQLKKERPTRIKRLAEAAALGDRSENAEYSAAKRDLRQLESRMRYLDKLIRYAEIVPTPTGDTAEIGTQVTIEFGPADDDTYALVGPKESGQAETNLASDSPLGSAILHHRVGDAVSVTAPAGSYQVTLTKIVVPDGL
ncbi:transcription elongation factor GreA [Lacticaseibacillus manihotivorans]|nr:transcription elongation factor GreA [Lacticaseibacillus manihotivorans]QFQ90124.1 transcription elongation factor GreA [Lacticaseibacillus manihotivorans]